MAKALSGLVQKFEDFDVIFEVSSGAALIERLGLDTIPDVMLLEVSMPDMDGYEVSYWLRSLKVIIDYFFKSISGPLFFLFSLYC
ncbi:Response regulator receiver domain-containing protein [Dyadobacter sp. SG02]|nr:Response regulator receiver domain-containing protein [Dyadobacter sp. SG02]